MTANRLGEAAEDSVRLPISLADDAARQIVLQLTPIIQARIARLLRKRSPGRGRDLQQEVEDFTQDVFVALFENDARILRTWQPERGLSLEGFVGLVAERRVQSLLRNGKRNPWTEAPEEQETVEDACGSTPPEGEDRLLSREKLDRAFSRLRAQLTPRAFEMFFRLLVEEEPVASIAASTGMSVDAIYAWRSRLSKELRELAAELARASWPRTPVAEFSADAAARARGRIV
jgi:RNA polymerase sigma-70 factor (ECF subfamily)